MNTVGYKLYNCMWCLSQIISYIKKNINIKLNPTFQFILNMIHQNSPLTYKNHSRHEFMKLLAFSSYFTQHI